MAEYLASIFGTEKDKVNCSFYFKIGACRHGDKCSRIHNRPTFSQTILLQNLYQNPKLDIHRQESDFMFTDAEEQQHFDDFFEEIFTELEDKYGEIEEMNVCDNIGEHMIGNVYVKFKREEDAERAVNAVNNRWFGGSPVYAELSPVTDFREACCRQYEMGECTRGGFCNFMHLKPISYELRRELYNRDHPWRTIDETKTRKKKRKSGKKKTIHLMNGADFSRTATNSSSFATSANHLLTPSPPVEDWAEVKRRKKTEESPGLPIAYQRVRRLSSSSECSTSSDLSRRSRSRLPSPFRDVFSAKRRTNNVVDNKLQATADFTLNSICISALFAQDGDRKKGDIESECAKGGFCNFMHLKPISRELRRKLYGRKRTSSPSRASGRYGTAAYAGERRRSRSRERERPRRRF